MSLPNPTMDFVPFDVLTAAELDDLVENDQALADGTGLNDGVITSAKQAAGVVVQVVNSQTAAVASGTGVIPYDDTIPQNTEGDEYLTVSITPKSATNTLVIEGLMFLSTSSGTVSLIGALFQDSIANALAAGIGFQGTATAQIPVLVKRTISATSTSARTYKLRGGTSGAGTTTLNGQSAARRFGGVLYSSLVVTEYKS